MSVRAAIKMAAGASLLALLPGAAHAWSKTFAVEWFEPAFHFGGTSGNVDAPGADCPAGANDFDMAKALVTSYRTEKEVAALLDPENPTSDPRKLRTTYAYRGPNRENIYFNPTTMPDPGFKEVQGKIAEGFDLDGDPNTGFTGADGTKGVDNNYYKATGCIRQYRGGSRQSSHAKFQMEAMRTGRFTVLVIVEGRGADPMNDEDVSVGFYASKDPLVKDAEGNITDDYSYQISTDQRFQTVFKAHIRDGVLEQDAPVPLLRTQDTRKNWIDDPKLEIRQARIRLKMLPDGRMEGLIGGWRPWYEPWASAVGRSGNGYENGRGATQGVVIERLSRFNAIGYYYALRRNADGPVNAQGQRDLISVAYRYYLRPAFAVLPGTTTALTVARLVEK